MIILKDLERAAEESGATIVAIDTNGALINVPDVFAFACALGQRNTEWDEEARYFLDARTALEGDAYRFTYVIDDTDEDEDA